jgi:hypothetical protein
MATTSATASTRIWGSPRDRVENIRRVAEVSKLMVDAGLIVLTAFISPFRSERAMARNLLEEGEFVEIHVDTPLAVAENPRRQGPLPKARRGELKNFTGIDSPYEAPEAPELRINTVETTADQAADQVIRCTIARAASTGRSCDACVLAVCRCPSGPCCGCTPAALHRSATVSSCTPSVSCWC